MKSEDIKPHKTNNIHSLKTKEKKSEYSGLFFQTLAHNTCIYTYTTTATTTKKGTLRIGYHELCIQLGLSVNV